MVKKGRGGGRVVVSVRQDLPSLDHHRGGGTGLVVPRHYRQGDSGGVHAAGGKRRYERRNGGYDECDDMDRMKSSRRLVKSIGTSARYGKVSASQKFEWEQLMIGRRGSPGFDDHHSGGGRIRSRMVVETQGGGFEDFRGDEEDVFRGDISTEIKRRRYVTHLPIDSVRCVPSEFVDRCLMSGGRNGNEGLDSVEHQLNVDRTVKGAYFDEDGRHRLYSVDGPHRRMVPPPSEYNFSGPIPLDARAEEAMFIGEKSVATKTVKAYHEDNKATFSSNYIPLHMIPSPYQPRPRTSTPLPIGKSSEHGKFSIREEPIVGEIERGRYFHKEYENVRRSDDSPSNMMPSQSKNSTALSITRGGEDGEFFPNEEQPVAEAKLIHEENESRPYQEHSPHCIMIAPSEPKSGNLTPPCVGYANEERNQVLAGLRAIADRIEREQYAHRSEGPRSHSDYGHPYTMIPPSEPKYRNSAPSSVIHASEDRDQAHTERAVAERIERDQYVLRGEGPKSNPPRCTMTSPSEPSYRIMTPSYACYASEDRNQVLNGDRVIAEQVEREQSFHGGGGTRFRHAEVLRHAEPSHPELVYKTPVPLSVGHARKHVTESGTQPFPFRKLGISPNHSTVVPPSDTCSPEESPYYNELHMNGKDPRYGNGHIMDSHELQGKAPRSLWDYSHHDEPRFASVDRDDSFGSHEICLRSNLVLRQCQISRECGFSAHLHDNVPPPYLDNTCNNGFKDGDFCADKGQIRLLATGYCSGNRCSKCSMVGNKMAPLTSRDQQVSFNMLGRTGNYSCHQNDGHYHRNGRNAELEHLTSQALESLIKRSYHIQNKDYVGSNDKALPNEVHCVHPLESQKLPVQERLGKPNTTSVRHVKNRLGPHPEFVGAPLSKKPKVEKSSTGTQDSLGHHQTECVGLSVSKVTAGIAKPDEDSEKFKEQAHHAFLEYAKHLFESPAQQRKYKGLDNYESITCCVCASSPKEFKDTQSLAMHAYNYIKVDSRHLAFLQALCVLMGWNSSVPPNSPPARLVLPNSDHVALKEDLIIWPPVVIVQNSSIGNKDIRKQKIVTIGKLESILKGEGYDGSICMVHRGNDPGILVVKFKSTFPAFQAAEKLHESYAKNKHGRTELKQITAGNLNQEPTQSAIPKVEDILFGYLGILEDLDKLEPQIKKWSSIKSKKEIFAVANAYWTSPAQ